MDAWKDDVRDWPKLEFQDIYDYFINAPACDEQPNRNFRSISEGINYLNSGWVGTIKHRHHEDGSTVILRGTVRFSQQISSYHQVEISVDKENRTIKSVKCDCIASEGKCCSHSAGLSFKINEAYKKGFIGITCTDRPCLWNRSTQGNVVPDSVENMCDPTSKSTMNSALAFDTDEALKKHLNSPHMCELASIPGTILNQVLTSTQTCKPANSDQPLPVHGHHDVNLECEPCQEIFNNYILLKDHEARKLACQTHNQNSALWTSQRKLRITSSSAASVPKKTETDPTKWIMNHIRPHFLGNADTCHGHTYEATAREAFEHQFETLVETTGLVVNPEESWLGASLDGIVDDNTILEIKCPTERKLERYGVTVRGLVESGTYDVRSREGKYFLRQSSAASGYYTQVQIAMYCSKRPMCKFMVWSKKDYVIADVNFDNEWFEQRLGQLRKFYFKHLLPKLTDSIISRELKIVKPRI
ncbi:uncharacterized protein LOC119721738 [Patiria miniata]|uniref:SWIM-type domain-containing protein n=1 Tax=Patiria miniata TaxID=46514 RepID=A0A913Z7D2_PATMI|nr:uncharacterized protein LOC119721738 [Patiria miniata]